jgi:multimeric flavodoxin WrbA
MRLVVHDLSDEEFAALDIADKDTKAFAAGKSAYCQGCFKCWVQTPGTCVINDELKRMGAFIGESAEMVVISRNCYGGYSEPVKRTLDRGISALLPFFTRRGGTMRHMRRYKSAKTCLTVILYGDFTDMEKEAAAGIVERNRSNFGYKEARLIMAESPVALKGLKVETSGAFD